jgi:hypothetical protein
LRVSVSCFRPHRPAANQLSNVWYGLFLDDVVAVVTVGLPVWLPLVTAIERICWFNSFEYSLYYSHLYSVFDAKMHLLQWSFILFKHFMCMYIARNIILNNVSVIVQRLRLELKHAAQQRVVFLVVLISTHYLKRIFTVCIFVMDLR